MTGQVQDLSPVLNAQPHSHSPVPLELWNGGVNGTHFRYETVSEISLNLLCIFRKWLKNAYYHLTILNNLTLGCSLVGIFFIFYFRFCLVEEVVWSGRSIGIVQLKTLNTEPYFFVVTITALVFSLYLKKSLVSSAVVVGTECLITQPNFVFIRKSLAW